MDRDICIVTGPFGYLPPYGVGAVEKLWYDLAKYFSEKAFRVTVIAKSNEYDVGNENLEILSTGGFERTGSLFLDLMFDFYYSWFALVKGPSAKILVANSFFSPILAKLLFRNKYHKVVYNVQRMPKGQMWLYSGCDSLIVPSTAVKIAIGKQSNNLISKVEVIGNPVDTNQFYPRKYIRKESDRIRLVYFGRICEEKGIHILAEAFKALDFLAMDLTLIGPDEVSMGGGGQLYLDRLNNIVPNIKYIPPISNSSVLADELSNYDIFCYPSIAENGETFGVSVIEAMALGLPVIVSNLTCFRDFVKNEFNGFIFDHTQAESHLELSDKLMLLIQDLDLRKKLSMNASITAKEFSVTEIGDKYLNHFSQLLVNK